MSQPPTLSYGTEAPPKYPPGFRLRRGRNWFFLGLTYASYYLCRYNLSPVAPELMRDLDLTKSQYGAINTGRDGAYAVGQMINGLFTDRFGGKQAMTIGAISTIILNLLFGLTAWSNLPMLFLILVFIRSADGYLQAFGAPGFIKINTAWFPRRERGGFSGIFGFMINLGAVGAGELSKRLVFGLSIPLLFFTATVPVMDWRYMFILPTIAVGVIVVLMNLFVKNTPEEAGYPAPHDDDPVDPNPNEKVRLLDVLKKMASNRVIWIVAAAYFCTGFVRRAIESWWAVYLDELWHLGKGSTLYTVFVWGLPATASFGSLFSGFLSDRFFNGRRAPVAAILYSAQAILTVLALVVSHGTDSGSAELGVAVVIAISMMCNSTHSLLGTAAAMDLGGRKMAGCAAGIIDSFQYYGALLSGYGLGAFFEYVARRGRLPSDTSPIHLSPAVWFGSMLPFGIFGAALMCYLWLRHGKSQTLGA